jgi:hypothetical protein
MAEAAHDLPATAGRSDAGQRSSLRSASPPRFPSAVERAVGPYRALMRFLERRPLVRAARAVPRTLRFMVASRWHGTELEAVPAPSWSPGFAGGVAMDEALLAMAMAPNRFPRRVDYARVSHELDVARQIYTKRGWLARPETYHRRPPRLTDADLTVTSGWAMGLRYEQVAYDSQFAPRSSEPGRDRWLAYTANRCAFATTLRHGDGPRPWAVCVHGFCMGYPFMDFVGLQTAQLHRKLGFNVALPVLPLHGPRKATRISGEPFLTFDLMNTVHGVTQSVWDIRRLLSWIRSQQPTRILLYGVSLGGYIVSLLAGLEEVDGVIAGIPVVDFPRLFHDHSPIHVRARSMEHRILGGKAEAIFQVVSPLHVSPKVPKTRRYLYAGSGDRLALPNQAHALWRHWEQPSTLWYAGNHVGYLWSRAVSSFVQSSMGSLRDGDEMPLAIRR